MFKLSEPIARTMSRHCLVFFFFNNTIRLKAVSYTGSVFVVMLLEYELQTNIKHISTEIANSLLPVPQKLTVCSSLCRSCLLSVGLLCPVSSVKNRLQYVTQSYTHQKCSYFKFLNVKF